MEQLEQMTQEQRERELVKHAMGNVIMAVMTCMREGIKHQMPTHIILTKIILVCHQILSEAQYDECPEAFIKGFNEMVESGELQEINVSMRRYIQSLDQLSDLIHDLIG
jgi:hypothetical protein